MASRLESLPLPDRDSQGRACSARTGRPAAGSYFAPKSADHAAGASLHCGAPGRRGPRGWTERAIESDIVASAWSKSLRQPASTSMRRRPGAADQPRSRRARRGPMRRHHLTRETTGRPSRLHFSKDCRKSDNSTVRQGITQRNPQRSRAATSPIVSAARQRIRNDFKNGGVGKN